MNPFTDSSGGIKCPICDYRAETPAPGDIGTVQGNTERFKDEIFHLWKCPKCQTIISMDPVDFQDIYKDYPLNTRQLDIFARSTLRNLLHRLRRAGMNSNDSILDFGTGNGIFVDFLKQIGYQTVRGYDPYVPEFAQSPAIGAPYDVIINNDTIEHCDDVYGMIQDCLDLLKPGGILYIGTADSEPVDMSNLQPHIMRLHQPFHRIILTERSLHNVASRFDAEIIGTYRRSYHDTLKPFANYRFLDELNEALGHNLDKAMDAEATSRVFMRTPRLWFFALLGYWFPSAYEPAVVLRKTKAMN